MHLWKLGVWRSLLIATICLLASCQSDRQGLPYADFGPPASTPSRLGPGSVVEFEFFYAPELNDVQTVRPDGKVSLELIGELLVADREPQDLRTELVSRYAPHLRNPEVNVKVQSFGGRYVIVGGLVYDPQAVPMPDNMTVLDAVMLAGGPVLSQAKLEEVVLVRLVDGERRGYLADLTAALNGATHVPVYLQPQDIVFVPRKGIIETAEWINQHIDSLIPQGFFGTKDLGSVQVGFGTANRRF